MTLDVPPWAAEVATALPYPLIFATVSGAHLYGFASADSDLDLRAAHLLPAAEVVGLRTGPETLLGFATSQERLLGRSGELKPALYLLRVLLTGAHLMRTGLLETDLGVLGQGLDYVPELIALKRTAEHVAFPPALAGRLARDVAALRADLETARDQSPLPDHAGPDTVGALHDLVVTTRLATR
jgi:RNA repair pathway DNA polymerase beta family protein